jgi:hypothetical protein
VVAWDADAWAVDTGHACNTGQADGVAIRHVEGGLKCCGTARVGASCAINGSTTLLWGQASSANGKLRARVGWL